MEGILTFKEFSREVDTHVAVPLTTPLRHRRWHRCDVEFLYPCQDTVPRAEPNNDFGHAEKERLDPVLHEFALKIVSVSVVTKFGRGLEFDPVDGRAWI